MATKINLKTNWSGCKDLDKLNFTINRSISAMSRFFLFLFFLIFFSNSKGNDSTFKRLEWIQDHRFHALTNVVSYESYIYLLGKSMDDGNLYVLSLSLESLDTSYMMALADSPQNEIKNQKLKLAVNPEGKLSVFDTWSKFVYHLKLTQDRKYIIKKVNLPANVQKILTKKPYDLFYAASDSFIFSYSRAPSKKKENFIEILSINNQNMFFNQTIKKTIVSGDFCSLYNPFQMIDLSNQFQVYPLDNLAKLVISDNLGKWDTTIVIEGFDSLDIQLFNQIDENKSLYSVSERFQLLEQLDTLNSKLNRYRNVRLFGDYLLVHYQKRNLENRLNPDHLFDIFQIENDSSGIQLRAIKRGIRDFSNCFYQKNCGLDAKLDTINLFVTNLVLSEMNVWLDGNKMVIVDNIVKNPQSYQTPREFMRASQNDRKIFSIAIYTFN